LVNRILGLTKNLRAAAKVADGNIVHNRYLTKEHQQSGVAQHIQNSLATKPDQTIAVLARSHKSLEPVAAQLHALGISVNYERQQNVLSHELVEQIIAICQAVQAIISGDENTLNALLCTLLRHPMFNLESKLLWEIAKENRYDAQWLQSMATHDETRDIADWLNWLATEATYQPLSVMVEHILGLREDSPQTYMRHYYVEDQQLTPSYLETLSAVHLLRTLVNEFAASTSPNLTDFLSFIATEKANGKVISDTSTLTSGDAAVELLSVHKAKGLEFDTVYIIDAVEKDWQPGNNREGVPANLPLQPPLESEDEYTRLMYVAATRAKSSIIFTSYQYDTNGEAVLPTPLILAVATQDQAKPDQDQSLAILEANLSWPRMTLQSERQVLTDVLANFTINATNLITFLDITEGGPEHFLQRSLLRLPEVKSDYMSHGTAMHAALELGQKLVNLDSFDLNTVKEEYRRALKNENLPKDRLPLQIEQGEKNLDTLFNDFGYQLPKGSRPEQSLSGVTIGNARIGGKLDRIDFIDKTSIQIVDYKTGSGLSSFTTKDKNKEVKAWKHKLQLTFYALLAKNHPEFSRYSTVQGQMVYLEVPYAKGLTLTYCPSDDEVSQLERLVLAVWGRVQAYDLPDTSAYEASLTGIEQFQQWLIDTM